MNSLCYRFNPRIYLFGTNSLSSGLYSIHSLLQMYLWYIFVWMESCPGDSILNFFLLLLDFSLTVKAAPHECVIRTGQP